MLFSQWTHPAMSRMLTAPNLLPFDGMSRLARTSRAITLAENFGGNARAALKRCGCH